jgi:Cu2+-exporting ATPase
MLNSSRSSSSNSGGGSISPRLMLQLAAAVEQQATHPVGKALVAAAAADRDNTTAAAAAASSSSSAAQLGSSSSRLHQQQHQSSSSSREGGLAVLEATAQAGSSFSADQGTFLQEPGSGAVAVVAGHRVSVGTLEWVQRQGAALTPETQQNLQLIQQQQQAQQQQSSSSGPASSQSSSSSSSSSSWSNQSKQSTQPLTGHTQVFVGVDGNIVGLMDVADMIRADARSTVQELQQLGLRTVMLSGDRQESALKVSGILNAVTIMLHMVLNWRDS